MSGFHASALAAYRNIVFALFVKLARLALPVLRTYDLSCFPMAALCSL